MKASSDDPQIRPVLLRPDDRPLPLPWQVLEGVGVEQRLEESASLIGVQVAERRIADDLLDAAAQLGARHAQSVGPARLTLFALRGSG